MTNGDLILSLNSVFHILEKIKRNLNGPQLVSGVGVDITNAMSNVQSAIITIGERKD